MSDRTLRSFLRDDKGNVSLIFALILVPAIGLIGMSIDYTMAAKRKALLDGIADSASLAAVTPAMLSQSDQASINAATALFTSQVSSTSGIGNLSLQVTPRLRARP